MAKIPFNIKFRPQIESGEYKVETGDGDLVRIVCWDAKRKYGDCVCGFMGKEEDHPYFWQLNGSWWADHTQSQFDLFIVTPEPELTEWQRIISACLQKHGLLDCEAADRIAKESSEELLNIVRKEIIDGWSKGLRDTQTFSGKAYTDGYNLGFETGYEQGKAEALKKIEQDPESSYAFKRGVEYGKEEVLKDLPRWKKENSFETEGTFMGVKGKECFVVKDGYSVPVTELLTKLPGFKEDGHE